MYSGEKERAESHELVGSQCVMVQHAVSAGLASFLAFAVVTIELFSNLFFSFVWVETFRFELEVAAFADRKFPQSVLHDPELPLYHTPPQFSAKSEQACARTTLHSAPRIGTKFALLFPLTPLRLPALRSMNCSPTISLISEQTRLRLFQKLDFIGLTQSAQHDDGDMFYEPIELKSANYIESRYSGQHHIEQNKIRNALASSTETLLAILRMDNIVPSPDERPSTCNPLEFAVFNYQYFYVPSLVGLVGNNSLGDAHL
jgi:hypothetical protein